MQTLAETLAARALDRLDTLIDFATLGEYGLEPVSAGEAAREGTGRPFDWEALAPADRREPTPLRRGWAA